MFERFLCQPVGIVVLPIRTFDEDGYRRCVQFGRLPDVPMCSFRVRKKDHAFEGGKETNIPESRGGGGAGLDPKRFKVGACMT